MAHHRQSHYGSQNDQMEHLLQSKVGSLKDIAIKIGDEAKYQNKLLRDMVRIYYISLLWIIINDQPLRKMTLTKPVDSWAQQWINWKT